MSVALHGVVENDSVRRYLSIKNRILRTKCIHLRTDYKQFGDSHYIAAT